MSRLLFSIIGVLLSIQLSFAQTERSNTLPDSSSAVFSQDSSVVSSAITNDSTSTTNNEEEKKSSNVFTRIKESNLGEFARMTHWGIMGGAGPASIHFEKEDIYLHRICNVRLGAVADYDLTNLLENLFVESGLEIQRKGYQRYFNQHADSLHTDYKEKTNLYYLIVPTTAGYKLHFRGFEFTPMVGLYYALAVGGRFKYIRKNNDKGEYTEQEKKYPMFGDKTGTERLYDTRRFDMGLRLAVGIEYFKGHRSSLGYDLGFIDVIKSDFRGDKYRSKNGVFYISHTYFFK